MVFESVVVDVLNRYLKPYVKKLDTSQLKVGVWKGHASLDKLELKEDLFAEADLDVPLKIKRSFIGKLEMQIPWKRLTKDPLVITIDEVYVIVAPNVDTKYDPEAALVHDRKEKEKKIEKFLETLKSKKKLEKENKKGKKKDSEKPDSFAEKLAVHLTKNLQVLVRDIHVRYEDSVTKPGTTLAAGATLHSLEVKSTDENWVPSVVRETATVIYKLLELNSLGVYWNSHAQSMIPLDMPTMIEEMRNSIARPACAPPPSNAYILSPMTGTAKLKMNVKIGGDLSMPQLVGGVDVGDIVFSLHHDQLKAVLQTTEFFSRHNVNKKYLKYRPSMPLEKDKKAWWRYAITAVLEEDVKRRTRMWSWKHLKTHRELCVTYQKKYHEKLHSVSVSSSLKEELQRLEDQMDWFNIMIYRKAAAKKLKKHAKSSLASSSPHYDVSRGPDERRPVYSSGSKEAKREEKARKEEEKARAVAKKEEEKARAVAKKEEEKARVAAKKEEEKAAKAKEKKSSNKDFFSKLKSKIKSSSKKKAEPSASGGGAAEAQASSASIDDGNWDVINETVESVADVSEILEDADEVEEKAREQLYKDIGYTDNEEWKYPKEYVGHEVHVKVNSLTLELLGQKSKIGNLVTEKIGVSLFHRPATNAISLSTSVHSMVMSGIPLEGQPTTLVTSLVGGAKNTTADLVNLQLEVSPIERPEMDITVKAALRPIQITYDFATVNSLIEMFKPPNMIHFQELTQAASASWEELKSQTSASLKRAVRDRKQVELDISLQSPFMVVPEKGQMKKDSHLIVADLGKLRVFGKTTDNKSATIKSGENALDKFYDTFTIKLDGMQVLVAKPDEDWRAAMATPNSSPLHILDPTGFEIVLLKSIVDRDALLPSLRVEGTLPGFEVKISDTKLASLVKVASSMEKPPALITVTDQYDALPPLPMARLALDSVTEIADLEAVSISTVDEGSGEESGSEDSLSLTRTPSTKEKGGSKEEDATAKHVFTDVSIKLKIQKVALKLTKTEYVKRVERQTSLLDVVIREMKADVVDRKWDTQGSVSLEAMEVLDYITLDANKKPTYLLKTQALHDGNFMSARFVTITRLGADFAAKYTGLQDTVSAQLSLVKINLNSTTVASLLQYATTILPIIKGPEAADAPDSKSPSLTDEQVEQAVDRAITTGGLETGDALNPNDLTGNIPKKALDLHFDVKFEGINISLLESSAEIVHTGVTGFAIKGRAQTEKVSVDMKINDLSVVDTSVTNAQTAQVIRKAQKKKDIVALSLVQYNLASHKRDPNRMDWVDTSIEAEMGRIIVNVDTNFVKNIMEFVQHLHIKQELFQSAAVATAETANATAQAIAETTKTAHRVKMAVKFHAPSVLVPYSTDNQEGAIHVNLGDFSLSNNFMHAHEMEGRVTDTISLLSAKTVLDCIEIKTSSIEMFRSSHSTVCAVGGAGGGDTTEEKRSTILEPMAFVARINRNISQPSEAFPNVDIILQLDTIKFHLHEDDVQAFLSIGEVGMKLAIAYLPSPPSPEETQKLRSQTLAMAKPPKRRSGIRSGFNTARPRATTAASKWQQAARLKRFHTLSGKEVKDVRVTASLKSLTLDFATIHAPLFNFTVSDLNTSIDVYKSKVDVSASVDSLSLVDLSAEGMHSKVVSLAEHTNKVSSLDLSVSLDKNLGPMAPMGTISTNLAQIRLVVVTPFVMKTVKFVKRLKFDFDPSVLKNASKVAQDGASAVSTMAHDKYFKVEVTVHAPVIIFPVSESSDQGFMLDLGSLAIQNTLLVPDQSQVRVGIDAYGIKLDSFKVSRVLLDSSVNTGSPVVAERVLLQPFHMLLALERNLCSWYTQIPMLSVNLTMGDLGILLGQEDLEQFFKVGMSVAEEVLSILPKTEAPPPPKVSDTPSGPLPTVTEESEEKPFKKFIVMSSLPLFELKLYKNEPRLSLKDKKSQSLNDCQKCALASFQLVTMELKVHVSSMSEVEVQASLKDIALCNLQEETEKRNTGNRVIQHYTSNPLKAFTGKIEKPLINISYILSLDKEHNVIVSAHDLLILSDVEFMSTLADYFRAIVDQEAIARLKEIQQQEDPELDSTVKVSEAPAIEHSSAVEKKSLKGKEGKAPEAASKTVLPKLKCQLSISNFRVAIIEDVYTQQPQALSLNLSSVHGHVQLSEQHKHASLSISELGIATSSFFDLDNTTSWILLPSNMMMTLSGPADGPAMDITVSVDPISLTLSPAVVRLIIHAVQTLVPKKEVKVEEPPRNLWMKQVIGNKFWFLNSSASSDHQKALPSTSTVPSARKGEVLTLSVESVEIMLEDEGTAKSAALPVLALNSTAVVQMYEWTGQLEISGEVHVEATYYNKSFSLWEPILETLERKDGKQILWDMEIKASKASPQETVEGDTTRKPNFSLELISNSPLQLTLTKTSMQLIKSLVDSYKKEYGKQVEGSVEVKALTGAPYTVINKLGKNTSLFVQPGKSLKLATKAEFSKLSNEESVDLKFMKVTTRRSHASLIGRQKSEADTIDIIVGQNFRALKSVAIDTPGLHYYTLIPKEEYDASMSTYGVVVDVAVTGTKKTIAVRSPIQFKNHLEHDIDLMSLAPTKSSKEEFLDVLKAGKTYNVPIEVAQTHSFFVRPTGFGYTPVGNHISWQKRKDGQHMELKCVMSEDNSVSFFSQVVFREEKFKMKRKLLDQDYPHHVFHIHPPIILQNLLPFQISVEALDQGFPLSYLTPGQSMHVHQLDLGKTPELRLSVIQGTSVSLKGKFHLEKKQREYATFPTTSNGATPTQLTLHSEDFGYLKVGIYCAFWMINKTGLSLEYKEGHKQTKHPCEKHTVLLSTASPKSKIQFRAVTEKQSTTDWTKSFAVNAVGTSGNFSAKLGENVYRFGVEIYLSQFTLTKMVMVTPYYMLANKTKNILKVHEQYNLSVTTTIPPGDVVPFWTLNNSDKMVLMVGETSEGKRPASSKPFNFKKSDNTVLQFSDDSEVVSVCLEVQETESNTLITFSPYYDGSVPLLVINHFPDVSLRFAQNIKGSVIIHSLSARESQYYVWDDPLAKKLINWNFPSASQISKRKPINVTKDCEGQFSMTFEGGTPLARNVAPQLSFKQTSDNWIEVEESSILPAMEEEEEELSVTGSQISDQSSELSLSSLTASASGVYRGYWKSFIDGLQRVLIFTPDENVLSRIKAVNSFSIPLFSASLALKAIGFSLVDNNRKRELAYISVSPSGVIWQLDKGKKKRIWKTLSHSVISILEEAYQEKKKDIKLKNLVVNLETMEMFSPLKGKLRRTHYDGVQFKFTMTEQDFAIQAKIGHVQVDNQLPFSVYPQVLYPLPPPPTIASTTEPKPFVEASIILKKPDKSNVTHFKYVHVLVQKISLNVDLGFILSLVDFFTLSDRDPLLELEYVKNDIEYAENSLMKTVVPELADDIRITRIFFDVLHLSPIKINLSFNVRSVGKNKGSNEISVGDHFLHLFLDSIGVILTSVQDTEMKFSLFHLEYQPQTTNGLVKLMTKHYRNQALFELHTLIFGLDVLGNPVSVVRGVVIGAKDLFYEPFKGSVLGPEEFFEGLGIGLRSFFGAGVVGGLTGAGAKITGAFGDVFAKLSFDDEFIEQRQQSKAKPPKMGWKLGGFAKNVLEGVTGVVTQPVKGLQKEGAVGLLKGTGKGLVGLLVRPTGGLVDLASGTLDFVTRKTKIGNFEISDVRPPRFIGRDGVIRPYSAEKAVGTALLVSVDEGSFVETDYYVGHIQVQQKPVHFLLVTDRRLMLIERKILTEGWTSFRDVEFETFESPIDVKDLTVIINYSQKYKDRKFRTLSFKSEDMTQRVGQLINHSYVNYFLKEQ